MPNLFSAFLDERKERPEDTVDMLEAKRSHIDIAIEHLKKEREAINKRLAKMEQKKTTSRRRLK